MDKNLSLKISGYISQKIIGEAVKIDYTEEMLSEAKAAFTDKMLKESIAKGEYNEDFETYYVIKKFCDKLNISEAADKEYLKKLYSSAKRYTRDIFYNDAYLKNIKIPTVSMRNILLVNACYERGELFQYDMPALSEDIVVPKLGYCDSDVFFPAVYEGNMPWVSVCPSEINSMQIDVEKAEGRCLVLGLGLGYYPYMISMSDKVKSITIVEISKDIISLFEKYILPQIPNKDKFKIVHADAIQYMNSVERDEFDFCYADIWEGQTDGAELYLQIKPHEKRLPYTRFAYWIEDEIRWYIENCI